MPFRELRAVGDARQVVELAIEMHVEPIHPGGLVDQALGDAQCGRRTPGQSVGHALHFSVECLGREHIGDQPQLERALAPKGAD